MHATNLYVVRHGESLNGNDLTDLGIQQAEQARDSLLVQQLGDKSLLLSSPTPRALHTADIIGEGIGIETTIVGELDTHSMEWIQHLPDQLDGYVSSYLSRERKLKGLPDDGPVIMVGHEPFVSTFVGLRERELNNGEIVQRELKSQRGLFGRFSRRSQ